MLLSLATVIKERLARKASIQIIEKSTKQDDIRWNKGGATELDEKETTDADLLVPPPSITLKFLNTRRLLRYQITPDTDMDGIMVSLYGTVLS